MKIPLLPAVLMGLLCSASLVKADPPKVIIDTDFNTIGDDGQVAVMAAQLFAEGQIDLLGFTVASGNEWRDQEVVECLRAVQRLGLENYVKVHVGAQNPLLHDYNSYLYEVSLFGPATDYIGAYRSPAPNPDQLKAPPDGFANIRPAREDAVDFIIRMVHRFPHEVTILEIAPPTDLALAIRKDPTIVPLIKQVVTMAGQIQAPGNAYRDAAEFNWWFDPEATQIVLRAAIPHYIIPLDCTNTVPLTKAVYEQIVNPQGRAPTIITRLYQQSFSSFFSSTSSSSLTDIYDTVALAFLVHPDLATSVQDLWVDINTTFDANYGKSIPYTSDPTPGIGLLQDSKVIFRIDNARFYKFYVDLLTRPVPVRFCWNAPRHDQ